MSAREFIFSASTDGGRLAVSENALSDGSKVYNVETCMDGGYWGVLCLARDAAAAADCFYEILAAIKGAN